MTAVPFPTLGPTGYVIPTEVAILAGVITDMQAAFGGGLNLSLNNTSSLSTPAGQMATSTAAIISNCFAQFLGYVAQTDPHYAQGRMQDGIGNLYFMTRISAQGTTVTGNCIGIAGTVIPSGVAVATDAVGNLYTCPGGTIPASGSLPMTFSNQVPGPTTYTGPLTIYQTTPGWDAITGTTLGALGQLVENAQAFEARRAASVAANSSAMVQSIRGAVLASGQSLVPSQVPTSVYVVENPLSTPATVGGITLPMNSVYVAAYGGNATAIANAIWIKKSEGCNYAPSAIINATVVGTAMTVNSVTSGIPAIGQTLLTSAGLPYVTSAGAQITILSGSGTSWVLSGTPGAGITAATVWAATVVVVPDTSYASPQPTYNVSYTVPVVAPINIQVTLAAASAPPSNALSLLTGTTGLATAFTGADGGAPVAQIGATVYGSRFYTTIAQVLPPGVVILSVLIGTGSPTGNSQALNINQISSLGTVTLVLA